MHIKMRFEAMPPWFDPDDRFCRNPACGARTAFVLRSVRYSHTFPCCDRDDCRHAVEQEMRRSIERLAPRPRRPLRILTRWLRGQLSRAERSDRELMQTDPKLWAAMHEPFDDQF